MTDHTGDDQGEGRHDGRHEGPGEWRGWISHPESGSGWDFPGGGPSGCGPACLELLAVVVALGLAVALGWVLARLWR